MKSQNPENKNQVRLFYCLRTAFDHEEMRHPSIVMDEIAERCNLKVLGKIPQTAFDGWDFWIEVEDSRDVLVLPPFLMDYGWKPVGEV